MDTAPDNLEVLDDGCFSKFVVLIHKLTGISIAKNRKIMVQGRLRKRVQTLGLKSYDEYHDYVCTHENEHKPFVDLVTTNETYFYRTPRIWTYIETQFLPNWFKQNNGKILRVWSAASSTGEEAYSISVLLQQFKEKNIGFDYEILASDISQRVLKICEEGHYQGRSIDSFKTSMPLVFNQYMVKNSDETFSVRADIRRKIKFFEHNLFMPMKDKRVFDLILIRNVFIYFKPIDQRKVLDQILPVLSPDGTLIIGESETLAGISDGLHKVENLIYKKDAA